MDTQIPMTVIDLFKLIGSPVFVGFVLSNVLENIPLFQQLASSYKFVIFLIVCAIAAAASYALVTYTPSEFIKAIEPWYGQIVGLIVLASADFWHKKVNKAPTTITMTAQPIDETNKASKG